MLLKGLDVPELLTRLKKHCGGVLWNLGDGTEEGRLCVEADLELASAT
jgi:hypothetical protein